MNNSKNADKRKSLLINPEFQRSFLVYTVGSAVGVSLLYFAAIVVFFEQFKSKGVAMNLPPDHVFFKFLEDQRFYMDMFFLVTTALVAAGLIAYGLFLSNQIAGPIHHIKSHMQGLREGRFTGPLKLRDSDYFQELAEEVNSHLAANQKSRG